MDFLGHKWNKAKDTFSFKRNEIATSESPITKRNCLAYLAQLWDPIGLVTPTTHEFRIDLQELWSTGYSWDDILPDGIQLRWKMNVQVLNQLLKYEFSRKLKPDDAVELPEIHGFGDVFFFVSPLKKRSIPRLELMGCLSLARVFKTSKEALEFVGIINCRRMFWVDSQIVLSWLKISPRKFKPFVSVRVAEIQETIDPKEFHFVKSSHNPADAFNQRDCAKSPGRLVKRSRILEEARSRVARLQRKLAKQGGKEVIRHEMCASHSYRDLRRICSGLSWSATSC